MCGAGRLSGHLWCLVWCPTIPQRSTPRESRLKVSPPNFSMNVYGARKVRSRCHVGHREIPDSAQLQKSRSAQGTRTTSHKLTTTDQDATVSLRRKRSGVKTCAVFPMEKRPSSPMRGLNCEDIPSERVISKGTSWGVDVGTSPRMQINESAHWMTVAPIDHTLVVGAMPTSPFQFTRLECFVSCQHSGCTSILRSITSNHDMH